METSPTIIDFPLRGEWVAEATPAQRVPTHGTDLFGQRYAYDFVGVEGRSKFLRTQGTARGLEFSGASTSRCLGRRQ
jgi:hypothetical protein